MFINRILLLFSPTFRNSLPTSTFKSIVLQHFLNNVCCNPDGFKILILHLLIMLGMSWISFWSGKNQLLLRCSQLPLVCRRLFLTHRPLLPMTTNKYNIFQYMYDNLILTFLNFQIYCFDSIWNNELYLPFQILYQKLSEIQIKNWKTYIYIFKSKLYSIHNEIIARRPSLAHERIFTYLLVNVE